MPNGFVVVLRIMGKDLGWHRSAWQIWSAEGEAWRVPPNSGTVYATRREAQADQVHLRYTGRVHHGWRIKIKTVEEWEKICVEALLVQG